MNTIYKTFLTVILAFIFVGNITAQEVTVGTDIVSRYIWRGFDLGSDVPSIQPKMEFDAGGFGIGFWGAYPTANPGALNEIDIYTSYGFALAESGNLSIGVTDYTNPNSGTKYGNFNNWDNTAGPGAHFLEANLNYSGPEKFPISLSFNIFFYNLENNPIYFQVGYSTTVKDVGVDFFVGGTPGEKNFYYGTDQFNLINVGITASKEVKFTDSFSLPVFGSVILNPNKEDIFFVLGFSL